ncbi:CAMK/CAMKL protein kinase [Sphaeroforma arctica JP610]|uniref:CAMK/CAMKL protein kinase n=1 Tax=Sphaeroforma arctica JP610 TaxID=667725 RepID=A0A0L0G4A2_9EUKA|nr:CAMK/CAMKL protein kinase [Sphaeroforma arctica JP610]KNC83053.1 CAMK/CAMKL protein kinase [Sphaeroforma arctica JP610]|eukprot:XP_014156955.1 CAMK/CAMKL protein kinase [Sphaeroforma arctica JP610]
MSVMYAQQNPTKISHMPVNVDEMWKASHGCKVNRSAKLQRFTDEIQLEVGSTAVVTKAYDHLLQRKVALKRMKVDHTMHHEIREYRMGKAIGVHPNVATMYENVYTSADEACLVMECADGGNLVDMLANRNKGLGIDGFKIIARQLAAGVSHMHKKGIAHRDIKSDNISLSSDTCNFKLLDFGESQFASEYVDILKCGTLAYISPELISEIERYNSQYNTRGLDFDLLAADVWSLGITFYSICTAQIPFTCASVRDSGFRNYLRDDIMGSKRTWRSVDRYLQTLLIHMCDPEPTTRWTMSEVVEYLDTL